MNKRKILIVSSCSTRGNTGGLTSSFINILRINEFLLDISLLDISFLQNHDANNYNAHHYYEMPSGFWVLVLMQFPYIRRWFRKIIVCYQYKKILEKLPVDLVVIYEMPKYTDNLVDYAHQNRIKTLLYPWGSDVLRAKGNKTNHHRKAFQIADYICGYYDSVVIKKAQDFYGVEKKKLFLFNVALPGVAEIKKISGRMTRQEMSKEIGLPLSSYNIVCGYNGVQGQRHKVIIENIAKIKDSLPDDYLLIFPVTYGKGKEYYQGLKEKALYHGLHSVFIEEYLTQKQMACLHLITDLFINIQPSDNGNAFLIEALSAKNTIICGKWLEYPQFEKYGIPYYKCNSPEDLYETISQVVEERNDISKVPDELVSDLCRYTPNEVASQWLSFFNRV